MAKETLARGRDRFRWVPWVLVPLMFVAYASHPTRKYYFDGVVFAAIIEHGPWEALFNPHHLLYTWLFYALRNALESLTGREIKALYLMQWANIALGAIGVGLIWRLVRRLVEDDGLAILVVLLGCFSFTWWHYTTDADVYIVSTLFLILAADRLEWIIRHRKPAPRDFVWIGALHAGSILFHQLNVFWIVCVAGCLIFRAIEGSRSQRWRWWWIYLAGMGLPVAAAYLAIGTLALGHTDPASFGYWITQYGHEPSYWISNWKEIPLGTLNGYLMVFFHRPSITPGILKYDLILALEEGRFWKGMIKKVFGFYSLGFLFFCYLAALYNLRKFAAQFPRRAIFLFSWLAPYVIFQFFFMPLNYFYKLFIFVPLLTAFAWYGTIRVSPEKKWVKWPLFGAFVIFTALSEPILAILVALFIIVFEIFQPRKNVLYRWGLFILVAFLPLYNYIAGIEPESRLANNPEVAQAIELDSRLHEGDLLIFEGGHDYPDGRIIPALTQADVVTLRDLYEMTGPERNSLFASVLERGAKIYVHPNITERTDQIAKSAAKLGISEEELLRALAGYSTQRGFALDGREFVMIQ